MYNKFQLAANYFQHWLKASNAKGHGMHSPFVYEFIREVVNDATNYPAYQRSEELRRLLLQDKTILQVQDFGAGSSKTRSSSRSVHSIAKNAAKPKKFGQLLFRIARHYQPGNIIELGTSLGITTSYLAQACPASTLITMEGAGQIAAKAETNFRHLGLSTIKIVKGNFDQTLKQVIDTIPKIDLAFIDGNHRLEPTVKYFHQLLQKTGNDSILIFDDIHWSKGMEKAWEQVKSDPSVRCSIDLFFIGIVLFRKEFREKRHFSIRF